MLVYWSPTVKYFHGCYAWYSIIAILCELIIGIVLPLILIFQRYLYCYCNIKIISIKPVIDQLMGCYKEEYRWFAAYYLMCRQVLYGVNDLVDYTSGLWFISVSNPKIINPTPFSKFTIMLTICILIMMIHVWFQPYKKKGLNILDSVILLTLVCLLISTLDYYSDRMIGIVFWFLPLLMFINYLAYFTKLKYLVIPCSCVITFLTTFYCAGITGAFAILFLSSSCVIFIVYVIYVLKCLCTRFCCKTRRRYLAINEQNDEVDEVEQNDEVDEDDINITEVSAIIIIIQCAYPHYSLAQDA